MLRKQFSMIKSYYNINEFHRIIKSFVLLILNEYFLNSPNFSHWIFLFSIQFLKSHTTSGILILFITIIVLNNIY